LKNWLFFKKSGSKNSAENDFEIQSLKNNQQSPNSG